MNLEGVWILGGRYVFENMGLDLSMGMLILRGLCEWKGKYRRSLRR